MVRENHKMVREMSGKCQGILWGLMAGHPDIGLDYTEYYSVVILVSQYLILWDLMCIFQQPVQGNNKENIKMPIAGPLWEESANDQWIPLTKIQ